MRLAKAVMTTAMAAATTAGLLAMTTTPAQAEGSYNIKVQLLMPQFEADYCLLSTTSGNARAKCDKKGHWSTANFRLSVPHNTGDRVWMDVNIVGATDRKGINLQGKHYITVEGDIGRVGVCGWKSEESFQAGNTGLALHGTPGCRGGEL